jgi:hypothetical protein
VVQEPEGARPEEANVLQERHEVPRVLGGADAFDAEQVERVSDHDVDLLALDELPQPPSVVVGEGEAIPAPRVDEDLAPDLVRPRLALRRELSPEEFLRAFGFEEEEAKRARDREPSHSIPEARWSGRRS